MSKLRVLTIISITLPILVMAGTIDLSPIADTYTVPEGGCYGHTTELWVATYSPADHFERTMIKFDLSSFMGQSIDSAVLHLYRFFGCPMGGVTNTDFYHATQDWDEDWDGGHINHGDIIWANTKYDDNGWWETDITELVQAWLNSEYTNNGLVMHAKSGSKLSKFNSREASSNKPYLTLTGSGVAVETQSMGLIKALFR
ncbi:MAG: hypothetical protein DRH44_06655 [Candidatus Coatesbacteria bacterium]|nr:MAG: hypothetical protein DRH44_06655 [Candidatus Coatesbacteria bacterium]